MCGGGLRIAELVGEDKSKSVTTEQRQQLEINPDLTCSTDARPNRSHVDRWPSTMMKGDRSETGDRQSQR